MKRVTGLGGVFFKCEDPDKVKEWYQKHLGLNTDTYGTTFMWRRPEAPDKAGTTQWSPFPASTDYFKPSDKPFMFNYRVENLTALLDVLRSEGVQIVGEMQQYNYGKFAYIMDCDGNKIELWEPADDAFPNLWKEGTTY